MGVCHNQLSIKKTRATAYLIGLSACLQSGFHVICNVTLHSFYVASTVKVHESSWLWWPLKFQNPDRCKYDLNKHLIWWRKQLQMLELSHEAVREWISSWCDEVSSCGKSRVRSRYSFIHPARRWLAACWIPVAGILHVSLQDVEVEAEDSLLSLLLDRSIDCQHSGFLGKETYITVSDQPFKSKRKKASLSFKVSQRLQVVDDWLRLAKRSKGSSARRELEGFFDFVFDGSVIFFVSGLQPHSDIN